VNKIFKYTNTFVIGFDDLNDPKRKEVVSFLLGGYDGIPDWVLFTATGNMLDDKGVSIGDQFRGVDYGRTVKVLEVGFSFENSKPFAVCTDDDMYEPYVDIKYLDELLDIRRWAKMNQYKDAGDDNK